MHNEILLSPNKDKILSFAILLIDLEVISLNRNKSDRDRQMPYDFTHMWIMKQMNNRTKQKQHTNAYSRLVVTRGEAE